VRACFFQTSRRRPSLPYLLFSLSPCSLSCVRQQQPGGWTGALRAPAPPWCLRSSRGPRDRCPGRTGHPDGRAAQPAAVEQSAPASQRSSPSAMHTHACSSSRINGASTLPFLLRFFLLPLFLPLVTDALMPFEDRRRPRELPGRLSFSPPSLYKRAAELSPILPYPSSPLSLTLLAVRATVVVAGVCRSSPKFAGVRHRRSPWSSPELRHPPFEVEPLLFSTRPKTCRSIVVTRTNPRSRLCGRGFE
jgi:hypothetical protein